MMKTKALSNISIASDALIIGILSSFVIGNQKTFTLKQVYILIFIALVAIICKSFSDMTGKS
jgi:hypothetical protein